MWIPIEGYKYPYRINEDAVVQKLYCGRWRTMSPMFNRNRIMVRVMPIGRKHKYVSLNRLMANAFLGGLKPGQCVIHKNKSIWDCRLVNLKVVNQEETGALASRGNKKSVEKIARDGNVIALYDSIQEASRKNYISATSVVARCYGKIKNPFNLADFTFRFEEVEGE